MVVMIGWRGRGVQCVVLCGRDNDVVVVCGGKRWT